MAYSDDQKWTIPERFRASTDLTDEAAHNLLLACDAEQKRLSTLVVSPFARQSPRVMYRRKAAVTIENLLKIREFDPLTDDQTEQLAESYASIGRYDLAAGATKVNADAYTKIWDAVFLDDSKWCDHGDARMHVSEYIWSIREQKELPLLRCGVCGMLNVLDKPAKLVAASQYRATHQGKTAGMSMAQIIAYHTNKVKKG